MKHLLIATIALLISLSSLAQGKSDFILKKGQDTTWCYITGISRVGGQVNSINYIDNDGNEKSLDKKESKTVQSLRMDTYTLDYIPMKSAKPDSYNRHELRRLDGAIKYYDFKNVSCYTDSETKQRIISIGGVATVHYSIIFDNQKHYDISGGNIKNFIQPYFSKNSEFKTSFPYDLTATNIMDAVRTYNNIKSGAKPIKPFQYKVYKELADYKAKKATANYDEFLGSASATTIAFQNNDGKKKYTSSLKSNWGYSIGDYNFRFNNGSYLFGPAFRIVNEGKVVYYEKGQDRFYREKEGIFVTNSDASACYISDNLTDKIVPLYNPYATKNTMMITVGSGANKDLKELIQKHPALFKKLNALNQKDPELYSKTRQIIFEYNQ